MTINYLEEIQSKGYLILEKDKLDIHTDISEKIDEIFVDYQNNEESLFKDVRLHNEGIISINDNEELDKLIKNNKNRKDWFQIWKKSPVIDEHKIFVENYNSKIVNLIYGIVPTYMHSEFTCFRKGCGIKSHKDSNDVHNPNRLCVILSYFSKDWKEEYGGCLVLDDSVPVLPSENTIVILDFTKNNIPHEVTEVLVDKNRLSLTTFIDYKK